VAGAGIGVNELVELSRKRAADFRYFAENHLKIRTVDFKLVPLRLNEAQRRLDAVVGADLNAGRPVRVVILKARQEGVSTYCEARLFHLLHQTPFATCMVVSHDDDSTQHLFDISKTYYDFLPMWVKPTTRYSNRKEIYLDSLGSKVLRSQMFVESALSKSIGRSWTLHGLHISELAYWPPRTTRGLLQGLLQAVPEIPGTMVFIESTACGLGGEFYKRFWDAWEGKSGYRAVFLPWFIEPRYSKPLPDGTRPEDFFSTLTDYELGLMEKYAVTPQQIYWRRCKIADDFAGDEEMFQQEFPAEPEEAFVSTSRSVFHKRILYGLLRRAEEPRLYTFSPSGKPVPAVRVVQHGTTLRVWEPPRKDGLYVIGCDVAEGLEKGDYSCAQVLDVMNLKLVAQLHGHVDPDMFGRELCMLGKLYNDALLAIEANNHGLTTINTVVREGYPYVYRRRDYDTVTGEYKEKLGWQTNSKTKPLAIDALNEKLRDGVLVLKCRDTIRECLSFVRDAAGHMGAEGDMHDDRVMALAIAVKVWEEVPKHAPRRDAEETPALTREERVKKMLLGREKARHEILGECL
jgi:hypothetical protein